jgi:cell division septation protein DedD
VEIYGEFARIEEAERNAAAGISLLALSDRVTPPAALPEPKRIEPGTPVVVSGAMVKVVAPEPEPVEPPKSNPFPEEVEPPAPAPRSEPEPKRRETVRPEETDFPL